jgi:hypothetical protein
MIQGTINKLFVFGALALAVTSCTKDLNRTPIVQVTSASVYNDPVTIKEALAKLYGGLTLSGQDVAASPDINFSDVGSNVYFRNWWESEELSTDEAVIAWNDGDLQEYHTMNWTPQMAYLTLWYNRVFYEITICNEFIRELPDAKISSFSSSDAANIKTYRNEARFLRALSYWHAIDNFGNPPFATETSGVGTAPHQASRDSVFNFVESELLDLQTLLPAPGTNEYGRVDQGAVWTLLAKLYLNAKVYTGTDRSTDCITYCNKITASGVYNLAVKYGYLFETDNHTTSKEIIFALRANGLTSQSYGNSTFLVHAAVGGNMAPSEFGIGGGWGGLRVTSNLFNLFTDTAADHRAMFYTNGQTLDIADLKNFNDGFSVTKFKNVDTLGHPGSDPTGNFVDLDFPLFRLGDVYLMYAEAVLRGGAGGSMTTALGYVNALRDRAYGNTNGEILAGALNLQFILDERGRELYWEGTRRTDLIRFGLFTNATYLWPWKGGVLNGTGVSDNLNIYPLASTDIVANPFLHQNPGY